jgi:hypothetical protein
VADEYRAHRRAGGEALDLDLQPFLEALDALVQVAPCLELGVRDGEDGDFAQRMLEERLELVWKRLEGLVAALQRRSAGRSSSLWVEWLVDTYLEAVDKAQQ